MEFSFEIVSIDIYSSKVLQYCQYWYLLFESIAARMCYYISGLFS